MLISVDVYLQDMELSDDDLEDGDDNEASNKLVRQPGGSSHQPDVKKNMRDVLESFYSDLV